MSDTAEPRAPSRSRPSRAQVDAQARQRRRRFGENDEGVDYNLWVDEARLDRENFAYRWVNDARGRIKKLEAQDWDPVSEEEAGCPTDRHGDIAPGKGEDLRVRLMRKPLDWFHEDHARKQKRIDNMMTAAANGTPLQAHGAPMTDNHGNVTPGEDGAGGLDPRYAYKPKAANEGLSR